jgi:hypothetical protein
LSVLPNLQINVTAGTLNTDEILLLENWAQPVQPGSWRLDGEKALNAIEIGHDIGELQNLLESRDDQPLPQTVESFIRQCTNNGKALKAVGSAVLIECINAEIADAIALHKETGPLCLRAGAKSLVVVAEQLEKFHERVHLLGYGMMR